MSRWLLCVSLTIGVACVTVHAQTTTPPAHAVAGNRPMSSVLDFTVHDIDGSAVALSRYRGNVLLIVNVASQCGLTPQYSLLQGLHDKYAGQGLVILAFPANDFGAQEPGTGPQIKAFCTTRYKVQFPLFAKVSVKGRDQCPLYQFLTSPETNGGWGGEIAWNFAKFLVSREGRVVQRFAPSVKPDAKDVVDAVEAQLARPGPKPWGGQ